MIKNNFGDIETYQFENLAKFSEIKQFISSRKGGFSNPPYDTLNISFGVPDDKDTVIKNHKKLAEAVDLPMENFVFCQQTHSGNVVRISEEDRGKGVFSLDDAIPDTDALITNQKGIALAVLAADCVPILLYDPVNKIIGAVHSGWKGTVAKIVQNTVKKMVEEFNINPLDVIAGIGSSIGPESYEVDTPVIEKFNEVGLGEFITKKDESHGMLNLWETNKFLLEEVGVKSENIEIAGMDTYQMNGTFFSDRRQRSCGRFIACITLS